LFAVEVITLESNGYPLLKQILQDQVSGEKG